jgi:hypothetical protein
MVSKVDHTVDFSKKIQRLLTSQKEILQQSIYLQNSTVDFNACTETFTSIAPLKQ